MNEKPVERSHVDKVEASGGRSVKMRPENEIGWPDRLDLYPIKNEAHRRIVAKYVHFVECKKPKGGRTASWQDRRQAEIRKLGYHVWTLENRE